LKHLDDPAKRFSMKDRKTNQFMSNVKVLFQTKPVEGLPLPRWILAIMVFSFSLPLMVIPITMKLVSSNPWVLVFWVGAAFPLTVLYLLRRLFTRFSMILYSDGGMLLIQPFARLLIAPGQLHSVMAMTQQAHISGQGAAVRVPIPWLFFYDATDKQITRVSPMAFGAEDTSEFLRLLAQHFPGVKIERSVR
jgi:hypothetical protein